MHCIYKLKIFIPVHIYLLQDLLITLSTLLRGSVYERLRWTFKLYDVNGDGCISRGELSEIVVAVHELMGRRAHQVFLVNLMNNPHFKGFTRTIRY